MPKLTPKQRTDLPQSNFAFQKQRRFPINDKSHARNALSRAAAIGGNTQKVVKAAVKKKFPTIK